MPTRLAARPSSSSTPAQSALNISDITGLAPRTWTVGRGASRGGELGLREVATASRLTRSPGRRRGACSHWSPLSCQ
jgi:hypothetical protein